MNEYLRNALLIAGIVASFAFAVFLICLLIWVSTLLPWGLIPIWLILGALIVGGAFGLAQLCYDYLD